MVAPCSEASYLEPVPLAKNKNYVEVFSAAFLAREGKGLPVVLCLSQEHRKCLSKDSLVRQDGENAALPDLSGKEVLISTQDVDQEEICSLTGTSTRRIAT